MKKRLVEFMLMIAVVFALCFSANAANTAEAVDVIEINTPLTVTMSEYSNFYYSFTPPETGYYEVSATPSKSYRTHISIYNEYDDDNYYDDDDTYSCLTIVELYDDEEYHIELEVYGFLDDEDIDVTTVITPHEHNIDESTHVLAGFDKEGSYQGYCTSCNKYICYTIPEVTTVKLSTTSYTYDGKTKTPSVIVKDEDGNSLIKGVDYTVSGEPSSNAIGTHSVKVTLKGDYSGSKSLTYKIIPAKVGGLKMSAQTGNSISLTWNKVNGAEGYVVYSYNSANKEYTKVAAVIQNSATISKLKAGTTYKYVVCAYKKVNDKTFYGAYSSIISATTKPAAPTLKASQTTNAITLSWNKVTGATGYVVYSYNSNDKKYTKVSSVTGNKATIKNLKVGTTYKYAVKAYKTFNDKNYYSDYSSVLTTTTNPSKPTGLKVKSETASIKLTWYKVANATGYQVQRYDTEKEKWVTLATVKTNSYTHSKAKINVTYKYRVVAYKSISNKNYFGAYSYTVSARALPPTVTGLKATSTASSVKLTWTKISGATGYSVYRYDAANKKYVKIGDTKSASYTVSKLKSSTTYKYSVKAYTKSGDKVCLSAAHAAVSIKTKAAPVVATTKPAPSNPSTSKPSTSKPTPTPSQGTSSGTYVLNVNSGKFHKPSCHMVNRMSASNKRVVAYSYNTMISYGYSPCKICF